MMKCPVEVFIRIIEFLPKKQKYILCKKFKEFIPRSVIKKAIQDVINLDFPYNENNIDFLLKYNYNINWNSLTNFNTLLLKKYAYYVNWSIILNTKKLPENIMETCIDRINHTQLFTKQKYLSETFIKRILNIINNKTFNEKANWYAICRYQKLPEYLIMEFIDKIHWKNTLEHQTLSCSFIRKIFNSIYRNKLNWDLISEHQNLNEEFIIDFQYFIKWESISIHQVLSESCIEMFKDKVSWTYISQYQKLSLKFIKKYHDMVDWNCIIIYQKCGTKYFINKYIGTKYFVDWDYICSNITLTKKFIRDNLKYLDINRLVAKQDLIYDEKDNKNLLIKYILKVFQENNHINNLNWSAFFHTQSLPEPLLEYLIEKYPSNILWNIISANQYVSEVFIIKHFIQLDNDSICMQQTLSEGFIEKLFTILNINIVYEYQNCSSNFIDNMYIKFPNITIDFNIISKYQTLSMDFISKYADKLNWKLLSEHQKLSEQIIEKFHDKVYWKYISQHQHLREQFIRKHIKLLDIKLLIKYGNLPNELISFISSQN
jgi:hypothetical protein